MKYMMIVKANADTEAGVMPTDKLIDAMTSYNEELIKAGVMVDGSGLHPSSQGVRIFFSGDKRTAVDGPFTEIKELIAGYWVIEVKSKEEAVEWAMRVPNPYPDGSDGHIELRRFFEMDDFGDSAAVKRAFALEHENRKSS